MSARLTPSRSDLAKRLRTWYNGGEKGMLTLCEKVEASEELKGAIRNWYHKGRMRLEAIAKLIEEED